MKGRLFRRVDIPHEDLFRNGRKSGRRDAWPGYGFVCLDDGEAERGERGVIPRSPDQVFGRLERPDFETLLLRLLRRLFFLGAITFGRHSRFGRSGRCHNSRREHQGLQAGDRIGVRPHHTVQLTLSKAGAVRQGLAVHKVDEYFVARAAQVRHYGITLAAVATVRARQHGVPVLLARIGNLDAEVHGAGDARNWPDRSRASVKAC